MKLSTLNGKMSLISVGTNAKTKKGDSDLALTAIMYLAPSTISGFETCPSKSKGCSEACLFTAGRGSMNSVQQARIRKTKLFFEQQDQFLAELKNDLTLFDSYCKQEGLQGYVRLNGTSDIKWEDFDLFSSFPNIRFYDYTKRTDRDLKNLPSNYKLTFSRSEDTTDEELLDLVKNINVSVVFAQVPETHLGIKVIEGDLTDLRWEDPSNVIVGLKAKGLAKSDDTGFVIQPKLINNINI